MDEFIDFIDSQACVKELDDTDFQKAIEISDCFYNILYDLATNFINTFFEVDEKRRGAADPLFKKTYSKQWLDNFWEAKVFFDNPSLATKILKNMLSDNYTIPPKASLEKLDHVVVLAICFTRIRLLLSHRKNIDISFLLTLQLAATRLVMNIVYVNTYVVPAYSNHQRLIKSAETTRDKASEKFQEVVGAYFELSKKVRGWDKKSNSQKSERIEEFLDEKKNIGPQEKSFRSANTIRTKDLPRINTLNQP